MTDSSDSVDTEQTDPQTATDNSRSLTRRMALGGGLAAFVGAIAYGHQNVLPGDAQTETPTPTATPTPAGETLVSESLWRIEAEHAPTEDDSVPSQVPSFDYDPVRVEVPETADTPVHELEASPAENVTGDWVSIVVDAGADIDLPTVLAAVWTDGERTDSHATTVDGQPVTFGLYSGGDLAIGLARRPAPTTDTAVQHLLIRATTTDDVRRLADNDTSLFESP